MSDPRSYTARINRVLDYVDAHLDDKLDLAALARVAYVSEWHFHRIFLALTGSTPGDWVRRRRLEVAAMRLLAARREPILKIALEVGFKSPEVFTRAFVTHFGVTPSAWRRGAAKAWQRERYSQWSKIRQEEQQRWVLADAQLDDTQRKAMNIDFDTLDIPRDKFVCAHAAWTRCRTGEIDANRYGFSPAGLTGLWFIASNLIRDAAALNGVEMLPWDVWGGMPKANAELTPDELAFFDRLAQLTAAPDEHADELRKLYETDERLRPGATVWNELNQANENIDEPPAGVKLE